MQQLLTEQLQELRIASEFSDVPMGAWLNQNGCIMPVVACNNWIMPKDCFVMIWFWLVCNGRMYGKLWDDHSWSSILQDLNPDKQVPTQYETRMLEYIYMQVQQYIISWDPELRYANFERILDDLAQDACA